MSNDPPKESSSWTRNLVGVVTGVAWNKWRYVTSFVRTNQDSTEDNKQTDEGDDKQTDEGDDKQTDEGDDKQTDEGDDKQTDEGGGKQTRKGGGKQTRKGGGKQTRKGGGKQTRKGGGKQTGNVGKITEQCTKPQQTIKLLSGRKKGDIDGTFEYRQPGKCKFQLDPKCTPKGLLSFVDDDVEERLPGVYSLQVYAEGTSTHAPSKPLHVRIEITRLSRTVEWEPGPIERPYDEARIQDNSLVITYGTPVKYFKSNARVSEGEEEYVIILRKGEQLLPDDHLLPHNDEKAHRVEARAIESSKYSETKPAILKVTVLKAPQTLAWAVDSDGPVLFGTKLSEVLPPLMEIGGPGKLEFAWAGEGERVFKNVDELQLPGVGPCTILAKLTETGNYLESGVVPKDLVVERGEQEVSWKSETVNVSCADPEDRPGQWYITFGEVKQPKISKGGNDLQVTLKDGGKIDLNHRLCFGVHGLVAQLLPSPNYQPSGPAHVNICVRITVDQWMAYLGYEPKTNIYCRKCNAPIGAYAAHFTIYYKDMENLPNLPNPPDEITVDAIFQCLFPPLDHNNVEQRRGFHITLEWYGSFDPRNPKYFWGQDDDTGRTKELLEQEIDRVKGLIRNSGVLSKTYGLRPNNNTNNQ